MWYRSEPGKGVSGMAETRRGTQQLLMDTAVDTAVKMTAQMLGISEEAVNKIVQVGLPMLARMHDGHPATLKALYTRSVEMLPEPVQQFYAKLAENPEAQQRLVDEFKTLVGPMMESLNRDTAGAAGTTPDVAGKALATTFPAVADALG